jgi:hypothetical protein
MRRVLLTIFQTVFVLDFESEFQSKNSLQREMN